MQWSHALLASSKWIALLYESLYFKGLNFGKVVNFTKL